MNVIIGVDEVGYGAIAGPLVVAAAAFESHTRRPVLKRVKRKDKAVCDSKMIPHPLMNLFRELVQSECVDNMVVLKQPWEIDSDGVHTALRDAMRCAVQRLLERIAFSNPSVYDNYRVIVDGDVNLKPCNFKYKAQPKADRDVWQVSAASILAKATQLEALEYMHTIHDDRYDWDNNRGYPTAKHLKALKEHGVTKFHRTSYKPVANLINNGVRSL